MSVLFKRKRLMAFLVVTLTMGAALFWAFSQDIRIMNDDQVETANCGPSTAGGAGYCTPSNLIFPEGCTYDHCGNPQNPQITFTVTDPPSSPLGLNVDPRTVVAVGTPLTASLPDNRIAKLPGRVTIYLDCDEEPYQRSASVSLDFIGALTKSYMWQKDGEPYATTASITPTQAGSYKVTCTVTQAIGRTLKDGTVITCASASASATTSRTVEVIVPALALTIVPNEIVENAGPNAATGTVSANLPAPEGGLTVGLSSSDEEEATVPAQVMIAAGQTVATFPIAAIDEEVADRDATVIITVTAVAHTPATASLRVCDNDWPPTTSLKFEPTVIYESGGQAAVTVATLKHNYLPGEAFSVTLTPSDPTQVTCPAELSFAAGEFTKTFTVTASDDEQLDGRQQIVIVASGPELYASGALTVTEVRFSQDAVVVPWQENGSAPLATYLTDPSVPVSWSPAERISADGTLSFGAEGEVLTVSVDGPGDTQDSVQVYVLKMDVVIDGIGESQEVTEGALLSVNNDDDDLSGVPDMNDAGLVVDEDDLIAVTLSITPPLALMPAGTISFTMSNASTVAAWWSVDRSAEVVLPMKGDSGSVQLPSTFYLEGLQHSDQMRDGAVLLTYTRDDSTCQEEARFTVIEVDLTIAGTTDDDEDTIGAIVPINDDDDNQNATPDLQDVGTVDGEDDLVAMDVRYYPADLDVGDLLLQQLSGEYQCRVWLSPTRGTELTLPHTWTLPAQQPPSQVYLEGIAASWGLAGMAGVDGNPPPPEAIVQATGLRMNGPAGATDAVVTATDQALDVDVDSDNNNAYALPDGTAEEDDIEDETPGKWLALNHHDGDEDGIRGYLDGWNQDGIAGNADDEDSSSMDIAGGGTPGFARMHIAIVYPGFSYFAGGDGWLSVPVWTQDRNVQRVQSQEFDGEGARTYDVYLEGANIGSYSILCRLYGGLDTWPGGFLFYDQLAEDRVRVSVVTPSFMNNGGLNYYPNDAMRPGLAARLAFTDADNDGIPDTLDGLNRDGKSDTAEEQLDDSGPTTHFIPIAFTVDGPVEADALVRFEFSPVVLPMSQSNNYMAGAWTSDAQNFRLWRTNAAERSVDDLLLPHVDYSWATFSEGGGIYLEPLRPCDGAVTIANRSVVAWLDPDGANGPATYESLASFDRLEFNFIPFDVDVDGDNSWEIVAQPSEPAPDPAANGVLSGVDPEVLRQALADEYGEDHDGVAVGLGDFDSTGEHGTEDRYKESLTIDETARLAVMAVAVIRNTPSDPGDPEVTPVVKVEFPSEETHVRLWLRSGDAFTLIDRNSPQEITSPFPASGETKLYAEGIERGSETVSFHLSWRKDGRDDLQLATDSVTFNVVGVPVGKYASDYFVPRQVEAPPYNVAKFDFFLPQEDLVVPVTVMVNTEPATEWTSASAVFYRASSQEQTASSSEPPPGVDTEEWYLMQIRDTEVGYDPMALYEPGNVYQVDRFYGVDDPDRGENRLAWRAVWDGRKSLNPEGAPELDEDGFEIWADQPEFIDDPPCNYYALVGARVNKRILARIQTEFTVQTAPMPQEEVDGEAFSLWGEDALHGRFGGVVDSLSKSLQLGKLLGLRNCRGFVPQTVLEHDGRYWLHTIFGTGWHLTAETRIMPVRIAGERRIYVLWQGNYAVPAQWSEDLGSSYVDILGERYMLTEDATNKDRSWQMSAPDGTIFTFVQSGLLREIRDRFGNRLVSTVAVVADSALTPVGPGGEDVPSYCGMVTGLTSITADGTTRGSMEISVEVQPGRHQVTAIAATTGATVTQFAYGSIYEDPWQAAPTGPYSWTSNAAAAPWTAYAYDYTLYSMTDDTVCWTLGYSTPVRVAANPLARPSLPRLQTRLIANVGSAPDGNDDGYNELLCQWNYGTPLAGTPPSGVPWTVAMAMPPIDTVYAGESEGNQFMAMNITGNTASLPDGTAETHVYDGSRRLQQVTRAKTVDGREFSAVDSYVYNDRDQLLSHTVASTADALSDSFTTTYAYYTGTAWPIYGALKTVTVEGLGSTEYVYRSDVPHRFLSTVTEPNGKVTEYFPTVDQKSIDHQIVNGTYRIDYTYEDDGSVQTVTEPKPESGTRTITYTYDGANGLLSGATRTGSERVLLQRQYDTFGRLIYEAGADGVGLRREYDLADRVIHTWQVTKGGSISENTKETVVYTPLGTPLRQVSPGLGTTYDSSSVTTVTRAWTVDNLSCEPTDYAIFSSDGSEHLHPESIDYDESGQVIAEAWSATHGTASATVTHTFAYDYAGRVIAESRNDVLQGRYSYDAAGNLLRSEDAKGNVTTASYYPNGHPHTVNRPGAYGQIVYTITPLSARKRTIVDSGGTTATTIEDYDLFGRLVDVTLPGGALVHHDYDNAQNLKKKTLTVADEGYGYTRSTTYIYNPETNDLTLTRDDFGRETAWTPDTNTGLTASIALPGGNGYSLIRDELNRSAGMTTTSPYPGGGTASSSRSVYGQSVGTTFTAGGGPSTSSTVLSPLGLTATHYPLGSSHPVTSQSTVLGPLQSTDQAGLKTDYELNETTARVDKAVTGPAGIVSHATIDIDGSVVGTETYEETTDPNRYEVSREYNELGLVKKITYSADPSWESYTYNGRGALVRVENSAGRYTAYTLNALDLPTAIDVNGRTTVLLRNQAGEVYHVDPPGWMSGYTIIRDEHGRVVSKRTVIGAIVSQFMVTGTPPSHTVEEVLELNEDTDSVDAHTVRADGVEFERRTEMKHEDALDRLSGLTTPDGTDLNFENHFSGDVKSYEIGGEETEHGQDSELRYTGRSGFSLSFHDDGRMQGATGPAGSSYTFGYDGNHRHTGTTSFAGTSGPLALGGDLTLEYEPDAIAFARVRDLPWGVKLTQSIYDRGLLRQSLLDVPRPGGLTLGLPVDFTYLPGNLVLEEMDRPGDAPSTVFTYTDEGDLLTIAQGTASVTLTREAASEGVYIGARRFGFASNDDVFELNNAGWLLSETRGDWRQAYSYRIDGARTGYAVGEVGEPLMMVPFDVSPAGRVERVYDGLLGQRLRLPALGRRYYLGGAAGLTLPQIADGLRTLGGATGHTEPVTIELAEDVTTLDLDQLFDYGLHRTSFDDGTVAPWSAATADGATLTTGETALRHDAAGAAVRFVADNTTGHARLEASGGDGLHDFWINLQTVDLPAGQTMLLYQRGEDTNAIELHVVGDGQGGLQLQTRWRYYDAQQEQWYSGTQSSRPIGLDTWHHLTITITDGTAIGWHLDTLTPVDDTAPLPAAAAGTYRLGIVNDGSADRDIDLVIDNVGTESLLFNEQAPLIVTGRNPLKPKVLAGLNAANRSHLHLTGLRLTGTSSWVGVAESSIANSVIEAGISLTGCQDVLIAQNTFHYEAGQELTIGAGSSATLRNNLFLNDGSSVGWSANGATVDTDYNDYWPQRNSRAMADDATGDEAHTGYHGALTFSRTSNWFAAEDGSDSSALHGSDVARLVERRRASGEGPNGWYAVKDTGVRRVSIRLTRSSQTAPHLTIRSLVERPDGQGGWTVEHEVVQTPASPAIAGANRVVLGVQGAPHNWLIDNAQVTVYGYDGYQVRAARDRFLDGFADGGYTNGTDEDDTAWSAVHAGLTMAIVDDATFGGNALAIRPTARSVEPLAVSATFNAFTPTILGDYVEFRFEMRVEDAGHDLANRLIWGIYNNEQGYHDAVFFGEDDGTASVDPVALLASDEIGEGAAPLFALTEGQLLAAQPWSAGEAAAGTLPRVTDTDWHQVSFTVTRMNGRLFQVTQTVDARTVSATVLTPTTHAFDEVTLGFSGAATVQYIDDVAVTGQLDGEPVSLLADSFADGGRDDGADASDTDWLRSADGVALSVELLGGDNALRLAWAETASPASVVGRFPVTSLGKDGDWLCVTFRTRVENLCDGTAALPNRLYWGLADTRPELHGMRYQPELANDDWRLDDPLSPLIGAGIGLGNLGIAGQIAARTDVLHRLRHPLTPTVGATEYLLEENTAYPSGRLKTTTVAGRTFTYATDAEGRLTAFSATGGPEGTTTASYVYDYAGRRVGMTVDDTVTRMVYDGDDVVAELVDEDGDGTVDRQRIYWLLPGIDQRLGFVDLVAGQEPKVYYYLCDQVGSVIQVVDDQGTVVNQYDYDAFGNLRQETSFETVPNRYRFQGREWDEWAGHYYYRYRTYLPEWGCFTGPDMDIRLESTGAGSYVAFGNSPVVLNDPLGLVSEGDRFKARLLVGHHLGYSGGIKLADEYWSRLTEEERKTIISNLKAWVSNMTSSDNIYQDWWLDLSTDSDRLYETLTPWAFNGLDLPCEPRNDAEKIFMLGLYYVAYQETLPKRFEVRGNAEIVANNALAGIATIGFSLWNPASGTMTIRAATNGMRFVAFKWLTAPIFGLEINLADAATDFAIIAGADMALGLIARTMMNPGVIYESVSASTVSGTTSIGSLNIVTGDALRGASAGVPSQLTAGQAWEAERLASLNLSKNTGVWRPTPSQMDSAAFRVIVGDPKFTPSGLPVGTTLDATQGLFLEIKGGISVLDSSYQLRLQTYRSLIENAPYTIQTSRPVNPTFMDWLQRWGVKVGSPQ